MNQVLAFLGLVDVLVTPTTAGLGDSERAMGYEEPWDDNVILSWVGCRRDHSSRSL